MPAFRFPIAGTYNSRVSAVNTLTSASGYVGSGIVGVMIVGASGSALNKDRRFINCWMETVIDQFNGTKTIYLVKRPGFAALNTPQAGSIGNDVMVWTGQGAGTKVISAFGSIDSSIYDGVTRLVTNAADTTKITGKVTAITETVISNVATLVISSSDGTAWYYQNAGTVTKITNVNYPGNAGLTPVGAFAHMDGYAFIMDSTGGVWNSDLNSVTAWSASSVIQANSYPDRGIGLVRKGDKIVAFGSETIQFFYNAGNAFGSVLSRIESMTLKIGCVSANAVAKLSNEIYWTGSSPEGGLAVYALADGVSRISTPEIDRILVLAGASNITMSSIKMYGRSFVIVTASTVSYIYCVEEKAWHEWNSPNGILWNRCAGVSVGSEQVMYAVSSATTSGKVFIINPTNYTYLDNGSAYTATAQSALVGKGNVKTFWEEIELIADQETSASEMSIYATDDDYQNSTLLGTVDLSSDRPRITRCGSAYRRAFIFQHSANTGFRIEALAGRRSEGTH